MPKTRDQKQAILSALKDKVAKAKSIVFARFSGLTVKDNEALRRDLRAENGEYLVAKKTFLNIALRERGLDFDSRTMDGQLAVVFGYADEVAPARLVDKYKTSTEGKIDFVGGLLGTDKIMNAGEVAALAKLPTKLELYAKLVGSMNASVSGFVNVLAGPARGFVTVLKAIADKKN